MANPTLIKATYFFVDDADYGWTESLHMQSSVATLSDALVIAKNLLPLRVRMLGLNALCNYIRVSDDAVRGDSQIYQPTDNEQSNSRNSPAPHDVANTCILLSLRNADNISRAPYYIRGQEDTCCTDGKLTPTAVFANAFTNWAQAIQSTPAVNSPWGIKRKDPLVLPVQVVNMVQDTATGRITITTASATGVGVNSEVTFKGFIGSGQPAGTTFVVSVTNATNFVINSNRLLGPTSRYGMVTPNAFVVVPINLVIGRRIGHRIAGRPSNLPRGRRAKAK